VSKRYTDLSLQFHGLVSDLVQSVQDNEPDVLLYYAVHGKDSEGKDEIVFVERCVTRSSWQCFRILTAHRYKSQAAFDDHIQGKLFQQIIPRLIELSAKPPLPHKGRQVATATVQAA
jgi:quinol monooxygenase YgiN